MKYLSQSNAKQYYVWFTIYIYFKEKVLKAKMMQYVKNAELALVQRLTEENKRKDKTENNKDVLRAHTISLHSY